MHAVHVKLYNVYCTCVYVCIVQVYCTCLHLPVRVLVKVLCTNACSVHQADCNACSVVTCIKHVMLAVWLHASNRLSACMVSLRV